MACNNTSSAPSSAKLARDAMLDHVKGRSSPPREHYTSISEDSTHDELLRQSVEQAIRRKRAREFFDAETTVTCLRKILSMLREEGTRTFFSTKMADTYYLECLYYDRRQCKCAFEVGVPLDWDETVKFVNDLNVVESKSEEKYTSF